jgi:MoxR-like ATPase
LDLHSRQVDIAKVLEREVAQVTNAEEILRTISSSSAIRVEPKLLNYINRIVRATRGWPTFYMGASPRAGIALVQGARTLAAFRGRDFAVPDDVVSIALPTLRHRVVLNAEAEVEGTKIDTELTTLLRSIEVPRL